METGERTNKNAVNKIMGTQVIWMATLTWMCQLNEAIYVSVGRRTGS